MQYLIRDEDDDEVIVTPVTPKIAGVGRVHVRFIDMETDNNVDMLLDDRAAGQLRSALRRAIRESEVIG